jgi:hypothetical protein
MLRIFDATSRQLDRHWLFRRRAAILFQVQMIRPPAPVSLPIEEEFYRA